MTGKHSPTELQGYDDRDGIRTRDLHRDRVAGTAILPYKRISTVARGCVDPDYRPLITLGHTKLGGW